MQRNGTDRGTERTGPFYAVFRKTLSQCNANGTYRLEHFLQHAAIACMYICTCNVLYALEKEAVCV